jgi:hypothetical protein
MNRWLVGLFFILALVLAASVGFGTTAQEADIDARSTAVAELQEWVEGNAATPEPDAVIADLQTRVAFLETAVASGEPGSPDGTPSAENVLFEANARTGFTDWTEGYFGGFSNQFTVRDGILVAEEGGYTVLYAPYLTETPDYILEAEIRLLPRPVEPATPDPWGLSTIAGIAARYFDASIEDQEGYTAITQYGGAILRTISRDRLDANGDLAATGLPDPEDLEWHHYRFELRGDQLRFLIDEQLVAEAVDDRYRGTGAEGRVGIVASLGPLEVRSFRVLSWE